MIYVFEQRTKLHLCFALRQIFISLFVLKKLGMHGQTIVRLSQAKIRRRTSHEPSRMQIRKNHLFSLISI